METENSKLAFPLIQKQTLKKTDFFINQLQSEFAKKQKKMLWHTYKLRDLLDCI